MCVLYAFPEGFNSDKLCMNEDIIPMSGYTWQPYMWQNPPWADIFMTVEKL